MPKPLPVLALGAFLAVDVVLVALVFQHVNREPPASDLGAASADAAPRESPATNQRAFDFKPARAATMDVANDGTWIFASRGACEGRADAQVFTSAENGAAVVVVADAVAGEVHGRAARVRDLHPLRQAAGERAVADLGEEDVGGGSAAEEGQRAEAGQEGSRVHGVESLFGVRSVVPARRRDDGRAPCRRRS